MSTATSFDPFEAPDRDDPWPALARLGRAAPACRSEAVGAWLVARYADVRALAADSRRLSSAGTVSPLSLPEPVRAVLARDEATSSALPMVATDPPLHGRLRRQTAQAVASRAAGIEPFVRNEATRLLDGLEEALEDSRAADLLPSFASPLPVAVIAELQGVPVEDRERVKGWSDDLVTLQWGRLPVDEHVAVAERVVAFHAYMTELVEAKRRAPGEDVISDILRNADVDAEAGHALRPAEVVRQMSGLFVAGHETTTNLIAHAVWHLLRTPGEWDALVADPGRAPAVVEEVLRLESSVLGMLRVATEDVALGEVTVPAGDRVELLYGATGRDPEVFAEPDVFDPDRDAEVHLAFGHGRHFCVGATLARLEVRVALELLTARLPDLALDGPRPRWKPNAAFRGPETLMVRRDPARVAVRTRPTAR